MKRVLVALLGTVLMTFLVNCRLSAQAVGNVVALFSSSSLGVPVHPGPGDPHYSRWANGSIATITSRDSSTGWYEVSQGWRSGWVIATYIGVLRPPTISNIPDQAIDENKRVGPTSFTVGDLDTTLSKLTLKAASSNEGLMPAQNVIFGGSDGERTLTLTPAPNQFGTATITVTVSDGVQSASDQFTLIVRAPKKQLSLTAPFIMPAGPFEFLIVGGDPGDTAVLEVSNDLASWVPVSTNVFPATKCAICPFIRVGEPIEESGLRFYRAINR